MLVTIKISCRIVLAILFIFSIAKVNGQDFQSQLLAGRPIKDYPIGLTTDHKGSIYISQQIGGSAKILKMDKTTKVLTVIAGGNVGFTDGIGTNALFTSPFALALDSSNNLYVTDYDNCAIRKIELSTGKVTTIAGGKKRGFADGVGDSAKFFSPISLTYLNGALYITEDGNQRIRKLKLSTRRVSTLVDSSKYNFFHAGGIAADESGKLYVSDLGHGKILQVDSGTGNVTFLAGGGQGFQNGIGANAGSISAYSLTYDGKGHLYLVTGADNDSYLFRKIDIANAEVLTVAGMFRGFDDGFGDSAKFYSPRAVVYESDEKVYVSDGTRLRIVNTRNRLVTTLFGNTTGALDGFGSLAQFNNPGGMGYDGKGNIYVADLYNHSIRQIEISSGIVSTVAGGIPGYQDGIGVSARFYYPGGVACDNSGNLFVIDILNHRIRKIEQQTGIVTTFAGSSSGNGDGVGTMARFTTPVAIFFDGDSTLYVSSDGCFIKKIDIPSKRVTTLAGGLGYAEGVGLAARFNGIGGFASDGKGNLFIADVSNNRIRKLDLTNLNVTTFAGGSVRGNQDGPTSTARFNNINTIAYDGTGSLILGESGNNRVRKIDIQSKVVSTIAGDYAGYQEGVGKNALFNTISNIICIGPDSFAIAESTTNVVRLLVPYEPTQISTYPLSKSKFVCYPNPASENLIITGIQNLGKGYLHVMDYLGKVALTMPVAESKATLDISRLMSGVYVLTDGTSHIQFLKE